MNASALVLTLALSASPGPRFCWATGTWLTASSDLFGAGHWAVVVCRNGAFEASSLLGRRTTGTLSPELKAKLTAQADTLPKEFASYSFGTQAVDSYTLSLAVGDSVPQRTYSVGDRLPDDGCRGSCATVFEMAKRLLELLPLEEHHAALKPWIAQEH
jgi:hypothetical protein